MNQGVQAVGIYGLDQDEAVTSYADKLERKRVEDDPGAVPRQVKNE